MACNFLPWYHEKVLLSTKTLRKGRKKVKLKIAAIVSPPAAKYMESMLPELAPYCTLALLEAAGVQEARALYEDCTGRYDAVVFSGRVYMAYATRNNFCAGAPCYTLDNLVFDLASVLHTLLLKDRNFDFSRVSIDMLFARDRENWAKLFPADQMPHCIDESFIPLLAIDEFNSALLPQRVLDWHTALYRAGETDLVLTCHGSITRNLEAAGVPYVYLAPAREYVVNFFLQIVGTLTMRHAEDPPVGVIILSPRTEAVESAPLARAGEALAAYAQASGAALTYAHQEGKLELHMQFGELSRLTERFTSAPFMETMGQAIREGLTVGIGTGKTLFQARLNAASALAISGLTDRIYYVSHDGRISGPLGYVRAAYALEPDPALIRLSKQCGVDHLTLQQMDAFARAAGKNTVSTQELAQFMGVSRRTANRLLSKLVSGGGAEAYVEGAVGGRGRPRNRYRLLFL